MKKILCLLGIVLCSFMMFSCRDKGFEEVELSDKMKEQIALDYNDYYSEEDPKYPLESGYFACLGKYKNVYFICFLNDDAGTGVIDEFATENSYVRIYGTHPFYGYLNHEFYNVEELYKLGKVTEEALLDLSDYTKEHYLPADMDVWEYSYLDKKLTLNVWQF